ncbi:uncharacterized protein LOC114351613, partial [Ostrinia furnacalis]|uniref:uncharacterized protein LOC114351613 n=1 Tax=Ostrinia furnacalis TaxID=93504 RepID=UPI00103C06B8
MLNLQPPPPFYFENDLLSVTSGNLNRQWTKWKSAFSIYFKACQLDTKPDDVQVSILLHIIGEKCRDVYEQFGDERPKSVKVLLEKFDLFFLPKKNLMIERHRFFTRNQLENESVEQYVFELNKLAATCELKDLKDELIKDRLICGLREDALRERLLRESELTLKKALDICRIAEMSRAQAGKIKTEQEDGGYQERNVHQIEEEIHMVQQRGRRASYNGQVCPCQAASGARARTAQSQGNKIRPAMTSSDSNRQPYRAVRTSTSKCKYCGLSHENDKVRCPAYGQRCNKCNKPNHFARMFRGRVYTIREDNSDQ